MFRKILPYRDKERRMEHQREYQRGWFQQNKERNLAERREQDKLEILNWFRRYKSTLHCEDCGISHPAVRSIFIIEIKLRKRWLYPPLFHAPAASNRSRMKSRNAMCFALIAMRNAIGERRMKLIVGRNCYHL